MELCFSAKCPSSRPAKSKIEDPQQRHEVKDRNSVALIWISGVKKLAEFIDLSKAEGLSQASKRSIYNMPNTRRLSLRKELAWQEAFCMLPSGTRVSS